LISGVLFALLFGQAKSSKKNYVPTFILMFFYLDAKEPKDQGCKKMAKNRAENLKFAKLAIHLRHQ